MPPSPGLQRGRSTTRAVRWTDRGMRAVITAGGLGTILAITGVCVFLVAVVLPLLTGARIVPEAERPLPAVGPQRVDRLLLDEYGRVGITVDRQGNALAFQLADGAALPPQRAFDPDHATIAATHGDRLLLARDDGGVQFVRVHLRSSLLDAGALPPGLTPPAPGTLQRWGDAFVEATQEHQYRRQELAVEADAPLAFAARPLRLADFTELPGGPILAGLDLDGVLHLRALTRRENLMTGAVEQSWQGGQVALSSLAPDLAATLPAHLLLTGGGDNLLLLWDDGLLLRLDCRDLAAPALAERLDVLTEPGARVTAVTFLIGDATLLVADNLGRVQSFFRAKPEGATAADGSLLLHARTFAAGDPSPVGALAISHRSRVFAAGHASGAVHVFHGTSGRLVASATAAAGIRTLVLAPRQDGLAALAGDRVASWRLDVGHPEVTLASIFLPVFYEGYARPEHVWQSTSGSDEFEPKFGLWPLVFGTLKATLYCLLFGVPLALLAAAYTSEFLQPRVRAAVKPVVELMASLPSVVLGFLAALVFAPLVEEHLCSVLALLLCLPLAWLCGAQVWQALPHDRRLAFESLRLRYCLLTLPVGVLLAWQLGPALEHLLFAGDLRSWLHTNPDDAGATPAANGSAFGGWFLLLLPAGALLGALVAGRLPHTDRLDRHGLRFALGLLVCLLASAVVAATLAAVGLDLRGALVGTYVQRNSLVVGFVMGFAVIPIVYTIAEDAFAAVPEHLRAASLGAGATPWQTAVRIVLPTAMSGVFSAVMVGLGRAVGETMIVLMATGNTPVLDLNLFNGFRTLSANIAVELPEAVRDSTHYRMLFVAALCLFVMTFALNTLAEVVRQRFRRRAFQL